MPPSPIQTKSDNQVDDWEDQHQTKGPNYTSYSINLLKKKERNYFDKILSIQVKPSQDLQVYMSYSVSAA